MIANINPFILLDNKLEHERVYIFSERSNTESNNNILALVQYTRSC